MLHKIAVNTGKILCGSTMGAVMTLAAAALSARTLGSTGFGNLVFIQALTMMAAQLLSFNTWQAIVTFGSHAMQRKDDDALHRLLKLSLLLDLGAGITAFLLLKIIAGSVVSFLNWPENTANLLHQYAPVAILGSSSAAAGTLRLFNRFGMLAAASLTAPFLRLIGSCAGFASGFDLGQFTGIYLVAAIIGQVVLIIAATSVAGRNHLQSIIQQPLRELIPTFRSIRSYILITNLHSSVKTLTREADQIIIAAFIEPAGLAQLKIARYFAMLLPMLADPLYQTLFTEFSRLHAESKRVEFWALLKKSAYTGLFIGLGASAIFCIIGKSLIMALFGDEYASVMPVALIFILAYTLALAGLPLQPAMLARGQPQISFKINLISTIIYLALTVLLSRSYGISGAATAFACYYFAWTVMMQARVRKHIDEQ